MHERSTYYFKLGQKVVLYTVLESLKMLVFVWLKKFTKQSVTKSSIVTIAILDVTALFGTVLDTNKHRNFMRIRCLVDLSPTKKQTLQKLK